jgi:hypothetical protein
MHVVRGGGYKYRGPPGWRFGMELTTLPCKKKIVEKPPRNSARFCGGGQGLSWAVEPRKERRRMAIIESLVKDQYSCFCCSQNW